MCCLSGAQRAQHVLLSIMVNGGRVENTILRPLYMHRIPGSSPMVAAFLAFAYTCYTCSLVVGCGGKQPT